MKKTTKIQILISTLSVLPLILVIAVYSKLPDKVPMHWDFSGTVEYDSKNKLFVLCFLTIFFAVLFPLLPKIDPKKKNYDKFSSSYQYFQIFMMLFMLFMTSICVIEALRPNTLNVSMLICIIVGALFIFLGNMMPRFRTNWFCGIRTPWTMSSEENWTKTHRLGGRIFFIAGIIILLSSFVPNEYFRFGAVMAALMAACIVTSVYSYIIYKKQQNK